jgi:hypothetical protein
MMSPGSIVNVALPACLPRSLRTTTLGSLGTSLSATNAQSEVQAALAALATSYQQSLDKIDCS